MQAILLRQTRWQGSRLTHNTMSRFTKSVPDGTLSPIRPSARNMTFPNDIETTRGGGGSNDIRKINARQIKPFLQANGPVATPLQKAADIHADYSLRTEFRETLKKLHASVMLFTLNGFDLWSSWQASNTNIYQVLRRSPQPLEILPSLTRGHGHPMSVKV